jgi:hypothetical protein
MHDGFLTYQNMKFLKMAAVLCVVAVVAYVWYQPIDEHNGGTWLGYTLGTIGALLIFWLTWLGIRKRRYGANFRLSAWVSAHVYLGLSLIVIATLHTGFQFGWNVHTLAYVLMMLVIISGGFGIYAYTRYPTLMSENRRGSSLDDLLAQIGDIDRECRQIAAPLPDSVAELVVQSCEQTKIGGSLMRILSGKDNNCGSTAAFARLRTHVSEVEQEYAQATRKLLVLIGKKCGLLTTVRRDIQLKAFMDIWLRVHVPMTVALLVALLIHIFYVFYYW